MLLVFKKRNNLIIQWGRSYIGSSGRNQRIDITMPISFTSRTSYVVIQTPVDDRTDIDQINVGGISVVPKTSQVFRARVYGIGASDNLFNYFNWFAIGY